MITKAFTTFKVLRILQKNMRLKTGELEQIQENKFNKLLAHAYQNVPFYRRLYDSVGMRPGDIKNYEDIAKIPITTKLQLQKAQKEARARNVDIWVEHNTSGSTGIRLSLGFSMEDALYNRGTYERARIENGFRIFGDTLLYIGNPSIIPSKKKWYEHFKIRRKEGLSVFDPLETQLKKLEKVKPDALWGYPSSIKALGKLIQEKEIKGVSPRLIFTASELLNPKTRNFINFGFNVDPIDVYVAEEGGCMAWECKEHSGYHVNMDTVLMEFVDEKGNRVNSGERGKVVITNLHSLGMPIIRYEIGDFAIPTYKECACGRPGYIIKAIEGRCDDFLKLKNGESVSPRILIPIIECIPGVSEFQIVQETEDEINIFIVKMKESREAVIVEEMSREIKKVFGNNMSATIKIVENISREKSGKLRSMISRL